MCVVQIGELVGQLSEEAKQKNRAIPWRAIQDTRNLYVHTYGTIDLQTVWNTLNKHPRRGEFKIMVGGAPITQAFADEIGADVYTEDAASAGQAAKALANA